MAVFPLFIDLSEKKCVVIGGGKVAERKTQTLLDFTSRVTVISPNITEKIKKLESESRLTVIKEKYSKEYLEGAFLVIAATDDRGINEKVAFEAGMQNIFVNVADCPQKCTFVFPSVVKRDELVIGISTSGGFPAISKGIREKIDKILPVEMGNVLKALKDTRKEAENKFNDQNIRKELFNKITEEVLLNTASLSSEELEIRIKSIFKEYENE